MTQPTINKEFILANKINISSDLISKKLNSSYFQQILIYILSHIGDDLSYMESVASHISNILGYDILNKKNAVLLNINLLIDNNLKILAISHEDAKHIINSDPKALQLMPDHVRLDIELNISIISKDISNFKFIDPFIIYYFNLTPKNILTVLKQQKPSSSLWFGRKNNPQDSIFLEYSNKKKYTEAIQKSISYFTNSTNQYTDILIPLNYIDKYFFLLSEFDLAELSKLISKIIYILEHKPENYNNLYVEYLKYINTTYLSIQTTISEQEQIFINV